MLHLPVLTYISLLFTLVSEVNSLNILIIGNSPYGSINSQILHKYLQHNSEDKIISIAPLSQYNEGDNTISLDDSDLTQNDLIYSSVGTETNLTKTLGLQPGSKWFDNGFNSFKRLDVSIESGDNFEWTKDMWYVKASPLGSLLFTLDYIIPENYGDISIDLVIVGPSIGSTAGLYEQSYKSDYQMMRLCLMRNIPTINLSGADVSGLSKDIISFAEASAIVEHGTDNDDLPGMIYAENIETVIKGLKMNDFGFHNFESSKLKLVNKVNDENDKLLNSKLEHHAFVERSNKIKRVLPNGVGLNINIPLVGSGSLTKETCQTPPFVHTKSFGGYNKIPALKYESSSKKFSFEEIYNVDEKLNDADSRSYFELNTKLKAREESLDLGVPGTKSSELSISSDCYISITPVNFRGYDEMTNLKFMYRLIERVNKGNFSQDFLSENEFYDDYEIEEKLNFKLLTEDSTTKTTTDEFVSLSTPTQYPVYEDDTFLTPEEVEDLRAEREQLEAESLLLTDAPNSRLWWALSSIFHILMKY